MLQENTGLIHAYIVDGQGNGQRIGWDKISTWNSNEGPIWIHLNFEHPSAQDWLRRVSNLNEIVVESLLAEESRPRCVSIDNGLLINLRGVNTNPGSEPEDMVSIRLFCNDDRIISTRRRRLLSVLDITNALDQGNGPKSVGEILSLLTHRVTERMSIVVSSLDETIDKMEEEILTELSQSPRSKLTALRREVIMLRRYLAPQREALNRLQSERASWLNDRERLEIREAGDRLSRYIEDLDSCRDRAAVAYEELTSRLSEEMNSRMYVLSIVAALFLPLGFLTGLFGINVGGIPLADDPLGFAEVSLVLLLVVIVQVVIFRKKDWF